MQMSPSVRIYLQERETIRSETIPVFFFCQILTIKDSCRRCQTKFVFDFILQTYGECSVYGGSHLENAVPGGLGSHEQLCQVAHSKDICYLLTGIA